MGVKLVSSSGGSVELVAPATATNYTQTLPANSGTVLLKESTSGMSVPAFSAYASSNVTLTNGSYVKVTFDAEEFDTNSNFASSRFTPTVAGYYQFNSSVSFTGSSSSESVLCYYKNGASFKFVFDTKSSTQTVFGSALIYLNGSTDYVEVYVYQNSSVNAVAGSSNTYFQGALVGAA